MLRLLYSLSLLEVAVGGGGRMAGFAPVSVRGLLAGICLAVALVDYLKNGARVSAGTSFLVLLFIVSTTAGISVGYLAGNEFDAIASDVAQVSFFLVILFFQQCFRRRKYFFLTERLIVVSAVFLAVSYIAVLFLIFWQNRFYEVYEFLSRSDDFFFRENKTFFFKGFVYLGVGFFFLLERLTFWRFFSLLIVFGAIILCDTRGMYMALALVVLFLYFRAYWSVSVVIVSFGFWMVSGGEVLNSFAKPESDIVRLLDMRYVFDNMDILSTIFGHGFGAEINGRNRIEVAWVEILYKQGIIGIAFWLYWFATLASNYCALTGQAKKYGRPYFASALFIFILSFTNPFMNNSIGLIVLIVAHFSLLHLVRWQKSMIGDNKSLMILGVS
ncbi:hypothetical protein [Ralstonia mannitolilytica]|uniref:O-antigen ligase domain-containing protein n=1 Tax=Ralstonia mannitolilytica TaxID=105219 RepID=A0AAD2EIG5_9RALS|nr:hypothetical protein [Ralstonia mannitolilytica]MBY4717740.1 hypothetical protein [Ralstonia mannitolilytica]CAJ0685301.1 hypothetical protein R77591_02681 [Ralstonia mannitolilytica]CAJ0897180.1 hypothetical protein R77569_04673 [Ralstonia mannitolilytica]